MAQETDFYKLPRVVQDRFVSATGGAFAPVPVAVRYGGPKTGLLWLGATGAGALVVLLTWILGFGSLESGLAIHGGAFVLVYFAGFFLLALGVLVYLAYALKEKRLPFRAGVYVFPACVIDARTRRLRVYPLGEATGASPSGAGLRITFGGASFDVDADAAAAERITTLRVEAPAALERNDPNELVTLDPLYNPRFSSPVGPRDPYSDGLPIWARIPYAFAGVFAIVLAPASWGVRNFVSDGKMYKAAVAADTVASYTAYLARASRYKDEIATVALPRAELKVAESKGTPEALLEYQASHPGSKIQGEVDVAMRAAMLATLEKAKADGTLASLQAFAKKYPNHKIEPELKAAIHAVFTRELEAYKAKSPGKDKNVVPWVERLFAWAEKKGGKVEVRFRRKPVKSLFRADEFLQKTPTYNGEISHPSKYFDAKHDAAREAQLGAQIVEKFDKGISEGLLDWQLGPAIETMPADAASDPPVTVPTLRITYLPEWSTHTYVSKNPRGSYVGIIFQIEVEMTIPGDAGVYKWKTDIFKGAALNVLKENEPIGQEEKVYETMAQEAFKTFLTRFFAVWFPGDPK